MKRAGRILRRLRCFVVGVGRDLWNEARTFVWMLRTEPWFLVFFVFWLGVGLTLTWWMWNKIQGG